MGELNVATLNQVSDLRLFISDLMIKSKKQKYIAVICCIVSLIAIFMELRAFPVSPIGTIALILGFVFLIVLFISMNSAEKSLNELHYLCMSINVSVDNHYSVQETELQQLKKFIQHSKKFITLYFILKVINWIVFLLSILTLFCEMSLIFQ